MALLAPCIVNRGMIILATTVVTETGTGSACLAGVDLIAIFVSISRKCLSYHVVRFHYSGLAVSGECRTQKFVRHVFTNLAQRPYMRCLDCRGPSQEKH